MSVDLDRLLAEAAEAVARMTPAERAEMYRQQRESFARAMSTPCEHGWLDFEQCQQCRERVRPTTPAAGRGKE